MSYPMRAWLTLTALALLCALGPSGCKTENGSGFESKKKRPGELDGMELEAAGRVALESAADAMDRRDLERLRMLSRWVRERAQVVLFEPNDLSALDLAIGCLDHSVPPQRALESLEDLSSGKLLVSARGVCAELAE